MSAFKKRNKSLKRTHRERGQLSSRKHLGLLEKHKDYVLRARSYQKKKDLLKVLHEKARNRNPDEFYYRMVNERLKDGRHVIPQKEEEVTPEQLQVMKTQDLKYVEMKQTMEEKKIERLRASLHLLSDTPCNSHTIFVDSVEEVKTFDPAQHFNTAPELVSRTYNRATTEQLSSTQLNLDPQLSQSVAQQSSEPYRELNQRIHRHRELRSIAQKMRTQKNLMSKGQRWKVTGNSHTPRTYRWKKERKR